MVVQHFGAFHSFSDNEVVIQRAVWLKHHCKISIHIQNTTYVTNTESLRGAYASTGQTCGSWQIVEDWKYFSLNYIAVVRSRDRVC